MAVSAAVVCACITQQSVQCTTVSILMNTLLCFVRAEHTTDASSTENLYAVMMSTPYGETLFGLTLAPHTLLHCLFVPVF